MQVFTVCFFGHRELHDMRKIDEGLIPILKNLILTKPYVSFLIGRNGEFDEYAASLIKRVRNEMGSENSDLSLVLPYTVADIEYYDSVIIPDSLSGTHPKSAITKRNRWMIDRSELVIVNVERRQGGAFTAMRYAERSGKKVINLF